MSKYFDYKTIQGDTFDIIALDMYSDEFKAHLIIEANIQYSDVLSFDPGVVLKIPIIEQESAATLPPWKR